ncbi:DUF2569 domain-containing protein [Marinicella sp. W31]|uniref:DUF2569 domain-containing protein n=1 Tax=Marinicella sp. W31 TaxID=3023713 RepID=UPI00375652BB
MNEQEELKGLGGWLILVGFGIVISPFLILYTFAPAYYSIFTSGAFEFLTTPGTQAYSPLWGPLIIGETVFNGLMVIASFYLAYLFFTKHYLFPRVFIVLTLATAIFIPLDAWVASFVITDEPMFDPETLKQFSRSLIGVFVWIPYMLVSERVKATFVEKRPSGDTEDHAESVNI